MRGSHVSVAAEQPLPLYPRALADPAPRGPSAPKRTAKQHVTRRERMPWHDGCVPASSSPVPARRQLGLSCRVVSARRGPPPIMRTSKKPQSPGHPLPSPPRGSRVSGTGARIRARLGRPGGGSREFQLRPGPGPSRRRIGPVCMGAGRRRGQVGRASRRFWAAAPLRLPYARELQSYLAARPSTPPGSCRGHCSGT